MKTREEFQKEWQGAETTKLIARRRQLQSFLSQGQAKAEHEK
jgi:hypothetical protein